MGTQGIKTRRYYIMLFYAAILGIVSGIVTFLYIEVVHIGQQLVWEKFAPSTGLSAPVFTLIICLTGGLVIGLLLQLLGDYSAIFAEIMAEFARSGRIDYHHAISLVVIGLPSLIFGGSLGPEAPLADATGGMGTWLAEKLKYNDQERRSLTFSGISAMLGAFITSPFAGEILSLESSQEKTDYTWMVIPGLLASSTATVAFVLLSSGTYFGNLYTFPGYLPSYGDLIWAVPLGVLGGLMGVLFIEILHGLKKILKPLDAHLVIRAVLGGLGLGLAGAFLPITLFSGETETQELITKGAEMGVVVLLALALVKVFITSLCLTTGWKGGYIFPTMFAGAALGMAIHNLFPSIPLAVAASATMAGAMVAVMKAPIFSALFAMLIFQKEEGPVIAIATVFSFMATTSFSILQKPKKTVDDERQIVHQDS
jgi:H+/Cl- antiporter ClcA